MKRRAQSTYACSVRIEKLRRRMRARIWSSSLGGCADCESDAGIVW
jgi:hypothetical protein